MTADAQWIEYAFVGTSLLVIGLALYLLREATIDVSVLSANKVNGPRKLLADANVRQEWFKVAVGFVMLVASISSLVLPPPPPPYASVPQSLVWIVAWIMVGVLMMFSSLLDKTARQRLLEHAPVEVQETVRKLPPSEHIAEDVQADRAEHPPTRRADDRT